jgi:hypothetical protein
LQQKVKSELARGGGEESERERGAGAFLAFSRADNAVLTHKPSSQNLNKSKRQWKFNLKFSRDELTEALLAARRGQTNCSVTRKSHASKHQQDQTGVPKNVFSKLAQEFNNFVARSLLLSRGLLYLLYFSSISSFLLRSSKKSRRLLNAAK